MCRHTWTICNTPHISSSTEELLIAKRDIYQYYRLKKFSPKHKLYSIIELLFKLPTDNKFPIKYHLAARQSAHACSAIYKNSRLITDTPYWTMCWPSSYIFSIKISIFVHHPHNHTTFLSRLTFSFCLSIKIYDPLISFVICK